MFDLIPTIIFPYYMVWLIYTLGENAFAYLFTMYLILLVLYGSNLIMAILKTKQEFNLFDALHIFTFPLGLPPKIYAPHTKISEGYSRPAVKREKRNREPRGQ